MDIPKHLLIHETSHWIINHRINSALPGYLMLGSKKDVEVLHKLPEEALTELGALLAKVQQIIEAILKPKRLYISRYGHLPGYPIHFHFIPVYDWLEDMFWRDDRYRLLQTFSSGNALASTDGAELTLYIWREFCERSDPPVIQGASVADTIECLRKAFR